MPYETRGRFVKTVEEAEGYIRDFLMTTFTQPLDHWDRRSQDYDVFLPRLMEIVGNLPIEPGIHPTPIPLLERLYIEAAWSMCMQGLLRPGPHKANSSNSGDCYGKGFCLTLKGEEWLKEGQSATPETAFRKLLTS